MKTTNGSDAAPPPKRRGVHAYADPKKAPTIKQRAIVEKYFDLGMDIQKAAKACNTSKTYVWDVLQKPNCKAYLADIERLAKERVADKIVQSVDRIVDMGITKETIAVKYWQLANLEPKITNGTITGQVKALDSLSELLGFRVHAGMQEGGRINPDGSVEIYKAKWLAPMTSQPIAEA